MALRKTRNVSMDKYVTSKTGVKVYRDYRDQVTIDKDNPLLKTKASLPRETYNRGIIKGLSRFGSENSEDIKTWNVFRSLQLNKNMKKYYGLIGLQDDCERMLFWGMDADTCKFDKDLKSVLDKIEPPTLWTVQQTEPDVVIIGKNSVVFNESKLGKPEANIDAWNRKDEFSDKHKLYRKNAEKYFKKSFINDFDLQGRRFYQLVRNYIIGSSFAEKLNKKFYLTTLVSKDNKAISGLSHKAEFDLFCSNLQGSSTCYLLTWDQLDS
ncbi:MAG: hypothetical protein PHO67_04515 [Candidatus Omnitrophica bacterium]|nr:hypothetical protein [Candidatus Omnitrophota bacterium]